MHYLRSIWGMDDLNQYNPTMTNQEILDSWREPIENVVLETFHRFKEEPKIILTESDLKCNLYMDLIKQNPYVKYAVHTEVTHYIGSRDDNGSRKYRFRDMSLLFPKKNIENEELWRVNEKGLNKGFKHDGPAIHIELKIRRQNISETNINEISDEDIRNLNELWIEEGREKRFVIVWMSRKSNYTVDSMILTAKQKLEKLNYNLKELVDVYLIDKNQCKKLSYENNWTPIDL